MHSPSSPFILGITALVPLLGLVVGVDNTWDDARKQAAALVKQLTLEEQSSLTYGVGNTPCTGQTAKVARLGIPGFCFHDSGNGVRGADLVNAYASGISVAASWNADLAQERGGFLGREFRAKGVHVVNGPNVGPIGRIATSGRLFESFGTDPYLSGKLAASTIDGIQESAMACVKHYIANEQELNRSPYGKTAATSANVDDKTLHELYLWPFQDAVAADVACVMTSYNRINGTYASANNHTLNNILKQELAFLGFVVSDWGAQHSGVESANAGLDVAMPNSNKFWTDLLPSYVKKGTLTKARLEDMAGRVLASWFKVIGGPKAAFPKVGLASDLTQPHPQVEARDPKAKPNLLLQAIESHVLLKNENNALPLQHPKLLSLFGVDGTIPAVNDPTSPLLMSEYYYGLQSINLTIAQAAPLLMGGSLPNPPQSGTRGTMWNGAGSASNSPPYISSPYNAISARAEDEGIFLHWDFASIDPSVNPASDACLVFINDAASEMLDRPGLADPNSDKLVINVATKCRNTIVVVHNPGIRIVDAWIDHPNVTALLFAHYPGQDSGRALVKILWGDVSPSGRLPYTVAKKASDYGALLGPCVTAKGDTNPQCDFNETIYIDYRHFQAARIEPRFWFGYGLTYSKKFKQTWLDVNLYNPITNPATAARSGEPKAADLAVKSKLNADDDDEPGSGQHPTATFPKNTSLSPPHPNVVVPGGPKSLFEPLVVVSLWVRNEGNITAGEVLQLYLHFPEEAENVTFLRSFEKVALFPDKWWIVRFKLTRRDLSRWVDLGGGKGEWRLPKGKIDVRVAQSAAPEDVTLKGAIII